MSHPWQSFVSTLKCLFGDADHSFGLSCLLFHRVMKMASGKRCPLAKSAVAAHWLPICTQRVLYSSSPAYIASLLELLETEKLQVLTNDFIYSVRIADSLVAHVLIPIYEFGKVIAICPYMKNYQAGFSFQSSLPLVWSLKTLDSIQHYYLMMYSPVSRPLADYVST